MSGSRTQCTARLRACGALAVLTVAGLCARARAEEPDNWERRPDAVELHLGAGTPVGYVGLVYDRTLFGPFSGSVGLGVGSAREGGSLQLAAGARGRVLHTAEDALYLELGWSTGGYRALDGTGGLFPSHSTTSSEPITYAVRAHWLNVLVGGELRADGGFALRAYAGLARILDSGSLRCVDVAQGRR
jgi:hypothetical protein